MVIAAATTVAAGLVASSPVHADVPGFSGDIAFQSGRDVKFCCRIYTMNADGSDVQSPLSNVSQSFDPAWSPDGSRLAFAQFTGNDFDVFTADTAAGAPGLRLQRLTTDKSRDTSPAWSPDGRRLAFISDRTGSFDVWRMNADGTNQTDLNDNPANDCGCRAPFFIFAQPAYSPDGTRIAFTSDLADPGNNLDVYLMNADGTEVRRLTEDAAIDAEPDWSPDGRFLAFASGSDGDLEIFLMDSNGHHARQLTHNSANDSQADWSPDGSKLAFTSDRDGNTEIYVMDADGSQQANLTDNPAEDERPDWRITE